MFFRAASGAELRETLGAFFSKETGVGLCGEAAALFGAECGVGRYGASGELVLPAVVLPGPGLFRWEASRRPPPSRPRSGLAAERPLICGTDPALPEGLAVLAGFGAQSGFGCLVSLLWLKASGPLFWSSGPPCWSLLWSWWPTGMRRSEGRWVLLESEALNGGGPEVLPGWWAS